MEEIEETEADKYNNIIIVNEDGLDNIDININQQKILIEPKILNFKKN